VLQHESTDRRVLELLPSVGVAPHIVSRPPRAELGTRAVQIVNQLCKPGVTDMACAIGAELREDMLGRPDPIQVELALGRVRKQTPDGVALAGRQRREVVEDGARRPVPGDAIPAPADHVGRIAALCVEQALQGGADALFARWRERRERLVGQQEEMPPFGPVEVERPRDAVEHLRRHADGALLLQPGVPGRADVGELGHLLPPQPWRAPARPARQSDLLGCEAVATRAQEVGQFPPAVALIHPYASSPAHPYPGAPTTSIRRLWFSDDAHVMLEAHPHGDAAAGERTARGGGDGDRRTGAHRTGGGRARDRP